MSVPSFFFNDTATTEIYTLSLHDALPISSTGVRKPATIRCQIPPGECDTLRDYSRDSARVSAPPFWTLAPDGDRKSTRLNSSHANISYAVFCLKKKTWVGTTCPTLLRRRS